MFPSSFKIHPMTIRTHFGCLGLPDIAVKSLPPTVDRVDNDLQAALDASGKGGKGGGKGDRAQGISQGVDTIGKAMEAAKDSAF